MGLGVLDDNHLEHVPGTAPLIDLLSDEQPSGRIDKELLKHANTKGKDKDVLLVPQPSRSPNDPLNWPLWKKDLMLFFICIDTAIVGAWGPMITPGFGEMSKQFGVSYNTLNGRLGWGIFVIGVSCFFTNTIAVIWGRRPIFLLGNLLLFVSSVWAYFAHSFNSLLAARLVGCVGMSPFEVLVTATIADIYFVHQRGFRLAMWGLCLSVGVGGSNIISGYIIEALGWNWTYGICAILYGVFIIILFLFCPETAYRRPETFDIDLGNEDHAEELNEKQLREKSERIETVSQNEIDGGWSEPKNPYWHDLKIFHGRYSDDSFLHVLCRPLLMLAFPQVLYSLLAYGLTSSWLVVVGSVLALIFGGDPYNFSVSQIGLVSISSLIGAIVGSFVAGPLADWVVKFMSRRNRGVYEPEFRLTIVSIALVLGGMSFFGFGWSLEVQDPWIGPTIFYGLQYFAVNFVNIAVYGYLADCHRDKAPEAFAAINLRNIYSFGMNYFISSWITSQGPKQVFSIIGGVHVFICLCTVPMYMFGKRCRSWTSRVPIFQKIMNS